MVLAALRRKAAKQLVEAVEKNVAFVGRARDHVRARACLPTHALHALQLASLPTFALLPQVDFSPKDLAQVATFLAKESAAKQVILLSWPPESALNGRMRLFSGSREARRASAPLCFLDAGANPAVCTRAAGPCTAAAAAAAGGHGRAGRRGGRWRRVG